MGWFCFFTALYLSLFTLAFYILLSTGVVVIIVVVVVVAAVFVALHNELIKLSSNKAIALN